jgi:hypothetical protein
MTATDEADTHARKSRKHYYRAAAAERQIHQLQRYVASEWAKALEERDLEIRAREAAAEALARAAVAATEEDRR